MCVLPIFTAARTILRVVCSADLMSCKKPGVFDAGFFVSMTENDKKHITAAAVLAVLCSVFGLSICVFFINLIPFNTDVSAVTALVGVNTAEFRPEPAERYSYLVALALGPLLLYWFYGLWLGYFSRNPTESLIAKAPALGLVLGLGWLGAAVASTYRPTMLFFAVCACAAVLCWYAARPGAAELRRRLLAPLAAAGGVFAVLLVAAVFLHGIFTHSVMSDSFIWSVHFPAVFQPVWEVFNGRALLCDLANQYGLYPHFLVPLFKLTGLSVLKFSVTFTTLAALSYGFMFLALRREIANRALLMWSFCLLVFLHFFLGRLSFDEVYLQYVPLRLFFPVLGLWLTQRWCYNPSPLNFHAAAAVISAGVLWNLDSGAVTLVAWVLTVGFVRFAGREAGVASALKRFAADAAQTAVGFALVAGGYAALVRAGFGVWPDFTRMFSYAGLYYGTGYFMLPMRVLDLWNVPALFYVGGLMYCVVVLRRDMKYTPFAAVVFMLSVLGAGLFSYFQGRSHLHNLYSVSWPAWLLAALFADRLFLLKTGGVASGARRAVLFAYVALALLLLANTANIAVLACRKPAMLPAENNGLESQAAFIAENSNPSERIQIISYQQAVLEVLSGRFSASRFPSISEMVLKTDFDAMIAEICSPHADKVFIDVQAGTYNKENERVIGAADKCRVRKNCRWGLCVFEKKEPAAVY